MPSQSTNFSLSGLASISSVCFDKFYKISFLNLVEKLKLIVIRQLFKNVQKMAGNHQLQLQLFLDALHFAGMTDCDMEELECIMAGLIRFFSEIFRFFLQKNFQQRFDQGVHFPSAQESRLLASRTLPKSGE